MKKENTLLYILWELYSNSRITYKQLSKKCNLSIVSCYNKVKELKNSGIIQKFTIEVNPKKLGYNLEVFIELEVLRESRKEVAQKICKMGKVKEVWEITGDTDLLIHAFFTDNEDLDDFISFLVKEFPQIKNIITRVILHKYEEAEKPWFIEILNSSEVGAKSGVKF
ncbi:hypothetical protein DRN39_00795, partial [Thermococci archaeon]